MDFKFIASSFYAVLILLLSAWILHGFAETLLASRGTRKLARPGALAQRAERKRARRLGAMGLVHCAG